MRFDFPPSRALWGAGLALLTLIPAAAQAAEKGKLTMDRVEFKGWKDNLRLSNGDAELIVTLEVGPRIISYRLKDGSNVFKEFPDQLGKSGESSWMIRGGHRLWTSPEDPNRTYHPDNGPVRATELGNGAVRLVPEPEQPFGLQKEIDVRLEPSGSRVELTHRIRNIGKQPTDLAPWALTVMKPGGVEVIPLPSKARHPGASDAKSAEDFGPSFALVLWPYTNFQDPRLTLGEKYIQLRTDSKRPATKLGLSHRAGWVGYLNDGNLFVKRFGYTPAMPYPDKGCNYETYTDENILEMETLGPLVRLEPGQEATLTEHWELFGGIGSADDEAAIDRLIAPKGPAARK